MEELQAQLDKERRMREEAEARLDRERRINKMQVRQLKKELADEKERPITNSAARGKSHL